MKQEEIEGDEQELYLFLGGPLHDQILEVRKQTVWVMVPELNLGGMQSLKYQKVYTDSGAVFMLEGLMDD